MSAERGSSRVGRKGPNKINVSATYASELAWGAGTPVGDMIWHVDAPARRALHRGSMLRRRAREPSMKHPTAVVALIEADPEQLDEREHELFAQLDQR